MLFRHETLPDITKGIKSLAVGNDEVLLLLIAEHTSISIENLLTELNDLQIAYFGGIFPRVISGSKQFEDGIVAQKFRMKVPPVLVHGLQGENFELPPALLALENVEQLMAFTIVDGLTANVAAFLDELYGNLGNLLNYLGGGAGSLTLQQRPCVFTREGLFQDAAVVCLLNHSSELSVRHGWQKLQGPLVATRTEKNKVFELNWQPAFEVYRDIVEQDCGLQFGESNFFDIAKGYPLGMLRSYDEDIVRDPIAVGAEGELICVGEVPENTVLYILKGSEAELIASAGYASESVVQKFFEPQQDAVGTALVIDCISRVLFLQSHFSLELEAVQRPLEAKNVAIAGALTLGEISSYGEGVLEFFNKTIVVSVINDENR